MAFAEAWPDAAAILQQPVGQLPWGHNLVLLTKLKTAKARLAYATRAVEHGWSRAVLALHIEQRTLEREGKAITNFAERLPKPQSDLARESLKDPYRFDFLTLGTEASEREIEDALVTHISRFLIELGAGFAYVGRQIHLEVDGRDFFIDLLFYHLRLRSPSPNWHKAGGHNRRRRPRPPQRAAGAGGRWYLHDLHPPAAPVSCSISVIPPRFLMLSTLESRSR